jgi:hypothetical protein
MSTLPYGNWTFNGRNGLLGGPNTVEELPDGRLVTVKDPDQPALLQDEFILNGIERSPAARRDFCRLFPDLDPISQLRLADLIALNPRRTSLLTSDQAFSDAVQKKQVTAGVRVRLPRAIRS